eukprot:m.254393 g.254393  ORF g.254393 m.254393 type:complete len:73 (+) comp26731_c0_seq10:224-442(+)
MSKTTTQKHQQAKQQSKHNKKRRHNVSHNSYITHHQQNKVHLVSFLHSHLSFELHLSSSPPSRLHQTLMSVP